MIVLLSELLSVSGNTKSTQWAYFIAQQYYFEGFIWEVAILLGFLFWLRGREGEGGKEGGSVGTR